MTASSVRTLLANLGFALWGDPCPQEEAVVRPSTAGRSHAQSLKDILRQHGPGRLSPGPRLGVIAAEFERERQGAGGAPDSYSTSEKYAA